MQAGDLLHQLVHGFGGEVAGHLGCRCCRILWLQVQELRASQQVRASASPSMGPSGCGTVASEESRQDWKLSRERQCVCPSYMYLIRAELSRRCAAGIWISTPIREESINEPRNTEGRTRWQDV